MLKENETSILPDKLEKIVNTPEEERTAADAEFGLKVLTEQGNSPVLNNRQVEINPLDGIGDASKLDAIRGSFKDLGIEARELPKRSKSKAQRMLRKVIKRALANA